MSKNRWTSRQKRLQGVLREIRQDANLTQTMLAEKLKAPQSYVSKYESGERRLDLLEVEDICGACGITLVEFSRKLAE